MNYILQFLSSKGGIVVGVLVLLLIAERLFPVAIWKEGLARLGRNFGLALLNFVAGPLIVIPLTVYATGHGLAWRPEFWVGWPGLLLDLLLLDLWIYWWHRINHLLPFLWRFHEVHHLDETLDASSALRFHFGEVILSAMVRAVVIVVLSVPLKSVVIFEIVIAFSALFHHSNLRLPQRFERLLSWVVVTPSIHWVHHHAVQRDTDSNYATVLSIWDRIFGSSSRTQRVADLLVGVEGRQDKHLWGLIFSPFLRR